MREYHKVRYAEMRSTPEGIASIRAKGKAYQARRRLRINADPEKRKEYLSKSKENWNKIREEYNAKRKANWSPEKYKTWYEANLEKVRAKTKKWQANNVEYRREYTKQWRASNPHYARDRMRTDLLFNITQKIRCSISKTIRDYAKGKLKRPKSIHLLGCSYDYFKGYIEGKFTEGMTWQKVIDGEIELDHIKPLASFFLICPLEQQAAFNYTNMQPLWHFDNRSKGAKLDWKSNRVEVVS